jgi:hypothetical protein
MVKANILVFSGIGVVALATYYFWKRNGSTNPWTEDFKPDSIDQGYGNEYTPPVIAGGEAVNARTFLGNTRRGPIL